MGNEWSAAAASTQGWLAEQSRLPATSRMNARVATHAEEVVNTMGVRSCGGKARRGAAAPSDSRACDGDELGRVSGADSRRLPVDNTIPRDQR